MFRIVCDPSSRSIELYFAEIRSGSLMFLKDIKLKITLTCFGSYAIHHQRV